MAALALLLPKVPPQQGANARSELAALKNGRLWAMFIAAGIGFGGMFTIYSYVKPIAMFEAGIDESKIPLVLALFGIGMTVGVFFAGRMMDIDVKKTVYLGFVSTMISMIFLGFTTHSWPLLLIGIFATGWTSQYLAMGLQGILMDLSPKAPSLGAALCHSALNTANASGAFFGGLFIAWNLGYPSLPWLGLGLTVIGFVITAALLPRRPRLDVDAIMNAS